MVLQGFERFFKVFRGVKDLTGFYSRFCEVLIKFHKVLKSF